MQKDFMAMAQSAPAQEESIDLNSLKEELKPLDDNNLPKGEGKEGIKARLLAMFEQGEILQTLPDNMSKAQFMQALDELAEAMEKQDMNSIQSNPLFPLLEKMGESLINQTPQQGQTQPAATKDFASMMPPSGGGLTGR